MVNNLRDRAYQGKNSSDSNYANFNIGMLNAKNESALNLGDNFSKLGESIMQTASSFPNKNDGDGSNNGNNGSNGNEKKSVNGMDNSQLREADLERIEQSRRFFEEIINNERNKPY
jgi:hypothetical protein